MQSNPLLEHFETPQDMVELVNTAVKYIEDVVWAGEDVKIVYLGLRLDYSEKVSCTHSAPFGRPTNWGGNKKDSPTDYPGWFGRVWVATSKIVPFTSRPYKQMGIGDSLAAAGINTGTGGGGEYNLPSHIKEKLAYHGWPDWKSWGWDVKLWADDWKEMVLANLLDPGNTFSTDTQEYWYLHINKGHAAEPLNRGLRSPRLQLPGSAG